jgi:hypothetical protein
MEMPAARPKRDIWGGHDPAFRQKQGTGHAGIHWNRRAAGLALAHSLPPRCERPVPVRDAPARDEQRKSAPPLDRYRFASKRESPSWSAAVVCRANRLFDPGRGIDREQLPHQLASLRRGLRATGTARCRHFFATFFVAAPRRSMRRAADCRQASRSRLPRNAASYGKRLSASDGTRTRDLRRDRLEVGVVPRSERSPNSTRDGA